jgi:amino acid adenylation domain-containing protein
VHHDERTIHSLVAARVAAHPDATALIAADGRRVSYGELDSRADAVARGLVAAGVSARQHVVVRMRRTPELVAALLAIMKAGAVCAAVDRSWPPARVQRIIDVCRAHVLLDEGFDVQPAQQRGLLDGLPVDGDHPLPAVSGADPCVVYFTSGSTGEPKGSVSPHRAVVRCFVGADYADFGPGRTVLQAAPVCWDAMAIELWSVLMCGGTSILLGEGQIVGPRLICDAVRAGGLDTAWLTSALFNAVVDEDVDCFAGVRQVLVGGERVSPQHVKQFQRRHPGIRLINGYGPVEATVFSTTHVIKPGDADRYGQIPLGTAIARTTVHVLDAGGGSCGPGEEGEICVGGDGLATGYLGDPELTARRFVTTSWGERIYRTGDRGRWHPDGVLLYLGRADRQVKIRGQRVEPAEVEAVLLGVDGVREAAITVDRGPSNATGLVAHCVADPDVADAEIESRIAALLPPYLRPRSIVRHDAFPLTPNGKLDRSALDAVPEDGPAVEVVEATGPLAVVLTVAAELLGRVVGPDDDLFHSGADSLLVMRLVSRLHRRHRLMSTAAEVHCRRTPRAIAAHVLPATDQEQASPEVNDGRRDIWLREQWEPGDPAQLLLLRFEITPALDEHTLSTGLTELVRRHPALRTGYLMENDTLVAVPLVDAAIPILHGPVDHQPAVFDLEKQPPLRCWLDGDSLTMLIHHIAYDGWSEAVLLRDLGDALAGRSGPVVPAVFGAGHDLDFWRSELTGLPSLELPAGQRHAPRFAGLRWRLDTVPTHAGVLAWFGCALHRLTGQREFAVGSFHAGRERVDEDAIGYFVRPLPIRLDIAGDAAAVAEQARQRWLRAIAHPVPPLYKLAALAPRPRQPTTQPVFQAALTLQTNREGTLSLPGRTVTRINVPPLASPFPLHLELWPTSDGALDVRLQCDPSKVTADVLPALRSELDQLLATASPERKWMP